MPAFSALSQTFKCLYDEFNTCIFVTYLIVASPPNCNTVIRQLASPQTGKAAVKLRIGKETLRLNLAIGVHKYDRTERGYLCSHTVVVIG